MAIDADERIREGSIANAQVKHHSFWRGVVGYARWRFVGAELLFAALTAVIALVIGVIALGVSWHDLGLRWGTGGDDQVLHYAIFSSALDTFPFFSNGHLGFPTDQNLFFAPLFDVWSAGFVAIISPFVPNGIWALNLYNMGSFLAVGFTSYAFFRALKLRRLVAVFFGVLFAVVPYHFYQLSIGHPFLANYWAVPVAGILVLMVAGERTNPFARWIGRASTRRMAFWRRIAPIVVLGAAVAWTQSYYYVFGALIVAGVWFVGVLSAVIRRRGWRELLWPSITTGTLLVLIGIQLAVLSLNLGDRYSKYFGSRTFAESEMFGGKLMDLILPSMQSGFAKLAQYATFYHNGSPVNPAAETSSTAIVASLAILLSFGLVMLRIFWRPTADGRPPSALARFVTDDRTIVLLTAFLGAFLFFMVSGLGTILAFLVTPEIRAWSRMSVVVSMLAIGVLAVLIDSIAKKTWVLVVTLVVIGAIAFVDQVPSIQKTLPLQTTSDAPLEQFMKDAEHLLPDNCGVVILPLKGFPESGVIGAMGDYDEALPYVYSIEDDLRWSYGAVRDTKDGDFWADIKTPAAFDSAVNTSGACAILIDTYAYTADLNGWQPLVAATGEDPAAPALVSSDTRYLLFTLPSAGQ
ncbi:MAG: hypothetical protein JWQ64_379 [Subtercola sp.]|nr:hypothetical protein [Subtercola sp.]